MHPDLRLIILTLVSSSIALGISSGVSVYEAEILEGERRVEELEKALIHELEDTVHTEALGRKAFIASIVVFATPLFSCFIAISPFILARLEMLGTNIAGWISILLSLTTLTVVGAYMARNGKNHPLLKGTRMALFGGMAFLVGYFLELML
jgi:predicted membrane protein (TIGR00267 family)